MSEEIYQEVGEVINQNSDKFSSNYMRLRELGERMMVNRKAQLSSLSQNDSKHSSIKPMKLKALHTIDHPPKTSEGNNARVI
jgi:hypothetical protein